MMMSVPLSWFSRWSERRLDAAGAERRGAGMIEVDDLVQAVWGGRGPPRREPVGGPGRGGRRSSVPSGSGKSTFLRCLNGLERFNRAA